MTTRLYSNDDLESLRAMPKLVTNPGARWSEKPVRAPVHRQRSFKVVGQSDNDVRFEVYQRQNVQDVADYSCGIAHISLDGSRLTLARYNGPGHEHGDIFHRPHIHRTTAESIASGRKPEREAAETDRYETLEGALACLVQDFHVLGISPSHDAPRLPYGS